jgi:histidinol-phosphate aminotransferase
MLPDPNAGLALIKPAVRAQPGYRLDAPQAPRKLNQNESPLDLPPELKQRIVERIASQPWHRYPEFAPGELLAKLARHTGWEAEGILVGNGSNELIQATLTVLLGAGDVTVAPAPTFALYRLLTVVLGGRYVPVPLGPDLSYDLDRMIEVARREGAKVVVVNSPNNPTGSVVPEGGVARLLAETSAFIVCDEAYQDFGGPSAIGLLQESSRLVVLRTFSKAMGMAGLRFGYALAHPAVAAEIAKAKLPYNVNALTLIAAATALEDGAVLAARTAAIITERERTAARLRALEGVTVYPSAANFLLLRFHRLPVREVFRRLHSEFGILVRDVSGGSGLEQCLRLTIGTSEDMDAAVAALAAILRAEH